MNKKLIFTASILASMVLISAANAQDLYVYPAAGQSDEQLSLDRYECHRWAAEESGFDPTQFGDDVPQTVRVPVAANEAEGATEKGAAVGAVAGAVIGSQDANAGQGAVVGAILGTMIGGIAEEEGRRDAEQQASAEVARQTEEINRSKAEKALRQANYRRALTACLEGRGYSVK